MNFFALKQNYKSLKIALLLRYFFPALMQRNFVVDIFLQFHRFPNYLSSQSNFRPNLKKNFVSKTKPKITKIFSKMLIPQINTISNVFSVFVLETASVIGPSNHILTSKNTKNWNKNETKTKLFFFYRWQNCYRLRFAISDTSVARCNCVSEIEMREFDYCSAIKFVKFCKICLIVK